MLENRPGPEDYSLVTYIWILGLAMAGGFVSFMNKLRKGKKWKWIEFVAEIAASAFAGVLVFYISQSMGLSQIMSVSLSGIAGHSSSKALSLLEGVLTNALRERKK